MTTLFLAINKQKEELFFKIGWMGPKLTLLFLPLSSTIPHTIYIYWGHAFR